MNVLITGGMGFLGSELIRGLLQFTDHNITNLDAMTYSAQPLALEMIGENYGYRYRFVKGKITNPHIVDPLIKNTDIVINFAAETHVDRSIGHWEQGEIGDLEVSERNTFIDSNYVGVHVLLESCLRHGIKKFVQVSTDEVYGPLNQPLLSKVGDPVNPTSLYASTKAGAELLAMSYKKNHGVPVIITRSANNYGPFQFPEKFIPVTILQALAEEPIPIYGDGKAVRDWMWVEDNCMAIADLMVYAEPGSIHNLTSSQCHSNLEVAKFILDILKKSRSLITFVKDRPQHDQRYAMEGITTRTFDLYEGLKKTIEHYRKYQGYYRELQVKHGVKQRIDALIDSASKQVRA